MKSLISSIKPEVLGKMTSDHKRRIQLVDDENFDLVRKKVRREISRRTKEYPSEDFLNGIIFALKQYYVVPIIDPANAHAISVVVDDAWHMHILDTDGYDKFCRAVVGEIMPHVHLDLDSVAQVENVRTLYVYTLEILKKVFEVVDEEFWPNDLTTENLICYHQGNEEFYAELQGSRLFEPNPRGVVLSV